MTDQTIRGAGDDLKELAEQAGETRLAPAQGIAAIALSMALKYHDINHVHDGALYQQYKLEGRNISGLTLDWVFETAIKIERHLMASSDRIAGMLIDALAEPVEDEVAEDDAAESKLASTERPEGTPNPKDAKEQT